MFPCFIFIHLYICLSWHWFLNNNNFSYYCTQRLRTWSCICLASPYRITSKERKVLDFCVDLWYSSSKESYHKSSLFVHVVLVTFPSCQHFLLILHSLLTTWRKSASGSQKRKTREGPWHFHLSIEWLPQKLSSIDLTVSYPDALI